MTTRSTWNRLLWGVTFNAPGNDRPFLIGDAWTSCSVQPRWDGEPSRTLLFYTRRNAASWCAQKNDKWKQRPKGDVVRAWRVRPVRVRETVREVEPAKKKRKGALAS